ncbi:unnamed protein product [Cunninghamella blakesleeana]
MTLRSRTLLGSLILLWLLYFNIRYIIRSTHTTTTTTHHNNNTNNNKDTTHHKIKPFSHTTSIIPPTPTFSLDTPSLINNKLDNKQIENEDIVVEDSVVDHTVVEHTVVEHTVIEHTTVEHRVNEDAVKNEDEMLPPSFSNKFNDDEKFLTFFTHSGFQNQLIQVENGILLAWYLNRTLILPKALLGEAFGWSYFKKLQLEHQLRDRSTSEDCEEYIDDIDYWLINCPNRNNYATVPFDTIFDLSWAKQHVKIIVREETSNEWLKTNLNIHTNEDEDELEYGSYVNGDILYFKGEQRYDYRIFDTPRKSQRLGKYAEALNIYELRRRKEKLIHFTSLFGSGKLPIRRPEHYEFLRSLQRSITYRHPAVLKLTDVVVDQLGGPGNYIGLHVRSGDGWFVNALPDTVRTIVSQIDKAVQSKNDQHQQTQQQTLLFDPNNMNHPFISNKQEEDEEGSTQPQSLSTSASITINDVYHQNGIPNLEKCVAAAKNGEVTLIYLATDAREPRKNEAFDLLWQSYPCTFTIHDILSNNNNPHYQPYNSNTKNDNNNNDMLDDEDLTIEDNDIEEVTKALNESPGWSILDRERNPSTGSSMRKFLLPLVDASISSRGWFFIGSKGSTFSGYIHRIHDIYWSETKKQQQQLSDMK